MREIRIGISMRETDALSYNEKRDSIARDWYVYLNKIMPNANWVLLPNISNDINNYLEFWKLNAFILTGGEDLDTSPDRDITEKLVFEYSQLHSFPILGICRGLQAIYKWSGGGVVENNNDLIFKKHHESTRHKVVLNNKIHEVNSYHSNSLNESSKPDNLKIIGRCKKDLTIEAIKGDNILGLMWHPEREKIISNYEKIMIKKLFRYEEI
tara:strand:+ start:5932 stop:6564 length:633 start_codon:yes stop_codon:yes gene_type:complete